MSNLKGSFSRQLKPPGYHIHAKYDLKGLRRRRTHGGRHLHTDLPLTSMIDMFSILIIFLLLNFSSDGEIYYVSKNIVLPKAQHSRAALSRPLVSISKDQVTFDAQKVGDNPLSITESDMQLPNLRKALQQVKAFELQVFPNRPFKGEVNIQADENIPLIHIKRVMNTLIAEGWTGIHFVVLGPSSVDTKE